METSVIKAIIGLGNPGPSYQNTRHNIGFKVVDALCDRYNGIWQHQEHMDYATIQLHAKKVLLIKPQTYMNNSGQVVPYLKKKGIEAENILVIHDELELPFGSIKLRTGGSARGHNGLKSIIAHCGDSFKRIRFGIARPEQKEDVATYVLANFHEPQERVNDLIEEAVDLVEQTCQ